MSLLDGARIAAEQCMNIRPEERVLILTDASVSQDITQALYKASKRIADKTKIKTMKPLQSNGQEPAEEIARLMKKPDVLFIPTSKSLTHTRARREASKAGVRIASMPGITPFSFSKGGLTADYHEVDKLCKKMYDIIKNAKNIHVISKNGTDLKMEFGDHAWHTDNGLFHKQGDFGNLPAGEVDTAPDEGTTSGILVIDRMGSYGEDIRVKIRSGFAAEITNSDRLENDMGKMGKKAGNVAELGIGTNNKAKIIGNVLEDEKVFGTVHIAFGNNASYGGSCKVQFHLDGIISKPTLIADNKTVIKNGRWRII